MRPVEAADYILELSESDEFKKLTKKKIELERKLEETKARGKTIRNEISLLNKARWPLLQKLYRIVNRKFDYFDFEELKDILW